MRGVDRGGSSRLDGKVNGSSGDENGVNVKRLYQAAI